MEVKVKSGQNLLDVCMTHYGSAEALVDLCKDNGLALDATLVPGQVLVINEANVRDAVLVAHYADVLGNYDVASGEQEGQQGIGYWILGSDFEVS